MVPLHTSDLRFRPIGLASEAALHDFERICSDDPFPAFPALSAIFRLNDRNAGESCEAPDADA